MATASISVSETPLVLYALRRADDALILGHRLSEWCGHAPAMEEDMALANMGLDLLGQARELYSYAAKVEGSTAICCCWNSRTAISRAPWCGSSSIRRSRTCIGAR
jgi:1,2-phenylacetyl-CoA epoxidase catalytic subunit